MEAYSRKGRDGRGVDFILAEAERRPDASLHVSNPSPPEVVFGVDVGGVRRLHDERAAAAVTVLANGKRRAVRKDQNSLLTVVASHPATMASVRSNPAAAKAVAEWESLTVAWLRQQYGDQLASVIRHTDESHPHLHAFILPAGAEMRAGRLHPGQEAKRAVTAAGPLEEEDSKALNRRADVAYRRAMREWQDSYWNAVGLPCGLTRLGPGRRRLTREEWHAEKTQAKAVQQARANIACLERKAVSLAEETKAEVSALKAAAVKQAAEIRAVALQHAEAAKRLHDAAEGKQRKARALLAQAQREGKRILRTARAEAIRLRSFGGRLRALWDGLRRSALEDRLRASVEADLARERARADEAGHRAMDEHQRRREAERRAGAAVASAQSLGRERDAARRRLAALLPPSDVDAQLSPGRVP